VFYECWTTVKPEPPCHFVKYAEIDSEMVLRVPAPFLNLVYRRSDLTCPVEGLHRLQDNRINARSLYRGGDWIMEDSPVIPKKDPNRDIFSLASIVLLSSLYSRILRIEGN